MRNIKRKVFALILSINSISGFSIGAMRYSNSEKKHYIGQQVQAEFESIGLPRTLFINLKRMYMGRKTNEDELKKINDTKIKIEIIKSVGGSNLVSSVDMGRMESLNCIDFVKLKYDEIPCFARFTPALKCFKFFTYYKRGKNNQLIELGLFYNDYENKKILKLTAYEPINCRMNFGSENFAEQMDEDSKNQEINIMPISIRGLIRDKNKLA